MKIQFVLFFLSARKYYQQREECVVVRDKKGERDISKTQKP